MAYCGFADVRARCDTDITDPEITTMIAETDAWLDLVLDMGGLTVPMQRLLSATRTAIMCMLKDPNAQALGEYSENRAEALEKLNREMDRMVVTAGGGMVFKYGYADLRWPTV